MQSLETIRHQVASMSDLFDIVGTLRAIAAIRVQEAQAALPGIRTYSDSVADGLAQAANLLDEGGQVRAAGIEDHRYAHDRLLILFTSEHGFVGGYNEVLLDRAAAEAEASGAALFVVGSRGLMLADERGLPVEGSTPMATHQSGILKLARSLVAEVYRRVSERGVRQVAIAYARAETAIASDVALRTLLPLDLSHFTHGDSRVEPLHSLPPGVLTEKLVEEYVMAELAHVATEALASENGARLKTMDSAHENIDEKLKELRQREHQMRQEQITLELLDIVSGAEAMRTQ